MIKLINILSELNVSLPYGTVSPEIKEFLLSIVENFYDDSSDDGDFQNGTPREYKYKASDFDADFTPDIELQKFRRAVETLEKRKSPLTLPDWNDNPISFTLEDGDIIARWKEKLN